MPSSRALGLSRVPGRFGPTGQGNSRCRESRIIDDMSKPRRATAGRWANPAPRDESADSDAAQLPPGGWPEFARNRSHAGRLVPRLGPPGHGGVGALQVPVPAVAGGPPQEPAPGAPLQELPSSRRSSVEPRRITVKSALRASLRDGGSATPDTDLPRLVRRLSEGWPGLQIVRTGEPDGEGFQAVHETDRTPAEFPRGDRE